MAPTATDKPEQLADADLEKGPDPNKLYEVLGLPISASAEAIKRAYRSLALKWHPDKNGNSDEARQAFQRISVAYTVLSDETKRKYYDQNGTTEDIDVSPEQFAHMFQAMFLETIGGVDMIKVRCRHHAYYMRQSDRTA